MEGKAGTRMKVENEQDRIQHIIITDIDDELKKIRPGYAEYKEDWNKADNLIDCGHPLYTVIEVNEYCNMNCKMCHRRASLSNVGRRNLDMNVLEKFVKEARDIGMRSFFLGAGSECLINPHIKDIIRLIGEKGNGLDNVLITNGLGLTEEICDLLIDCGWEKVFVSLDAATPGTYKGIRGCDLQKVESNLLRLLEKRKERKSKVPFVRVSFVVMDDNRHEIPAFIEKWKDKVDRIDFQTLFDEEKATTIETGLPVPTQRCKDVFKKGMLLVDGNYYPCKMYERKKPIGSANDMTLKEAWNSLEMKRLRDSMVTGEMDDVCRTCLHRREDNCIAIDKMPTGN